MKEPLPWELDEIIRSLSKDWKLVSLEFWNMGWFAHLQMKKREFDLVSDRGYIDVYEVVAGRRQHILPPANQIHSISLEQIVALLTTAVH